MLVKCIKEDLDKSITEFNCYEVLDIDGDYYEIRNDWGGKYYYHKARFEVAKY